MAPGAPPVAPRARRTSRVTAAKEVGAAPHCDADSRAHQWASRSQNFCRRHCTHRASHSSLSLCVALHFVSICPHRWTPRRSSNADAPHSTVSRDPGGRGACSRPPGEATAFAGGPRPAPGLHPPPHALNLTRIHIFAAQPHLAAIRAVWTQGAGSGSRWAAGTSARASGAAASRANGRFPHHRPPLTAIPRSGAVRLPARAMRAAPPSRSGVRAYAIAVGEKLPDAKFRWGCQLGVRSRARARPPWLRRAGRPSACMQPAHPTHTQAAHGPAFPLPHAQPPSRRAPLPPSCGTLSPRPACAPHTSAPPVGTLTRRAT